MTEISLVLMHLLPGRQTHPEAARIEVQFPGPQAAGRHPRVNRMKARCGGQVPSTQKKVDQPRPRTEEKTQPGGHCLAHHGVDKSREVLPSLSVCPGP